MTNKSSWDKNRMCPCGTGGCLCLPNPQDVPLLPGERIEFGHITDVGRDEGGFFDRVWIHHVGMSLVSTRQPKQKMINGFWRVLEALLQRTVHLPGQDEETRLWATEKILGLPSRSPEVTS